MALGPVPGASEFAEFVETVRDHRDRTAQVVRIALDRVRDRHPDVTDGGIADATRAFEGILHDLDTATEELRVQSEALFEARVELDDASAVFRDLFELAPCAYFVTTLEGRIAYANEAASQLLCRTRNALIGKPIVCFVPPENRSAFRTALTRSCITSAVSTWPLVLSPSGASVSIPCRARVRVTSPGSAATHRRMLFWNITEETDEDLF